MEPAETAKVCALLAAAFPAWVLKEDTISVWHLSLQDLPGDVVLRAAQLWVISEEKYPTIAGIRRMTAEVSGVLAPSGTEAWEQVQRLLAEKTPLSHDLIDKAARVIGWWELRHSENVTATRAQFLRAYEDLRKGYNASVVNQIGFTTGQPMVASNDYRQSAIAAP